MKGKLLICGVVAVVVTTICGFVFGSSQSEPLETFEPPFETTSMSWAQLVEIIQKNKGSSIKEITLEVSVVPSSDFPKLEVQFRKPNRKASVSERELKIKSIGTNCGILDHRPVNMRKLEWLIEQSVINRIDVVKKIVALNYNPGCDKISSEYIVFNGKHTQVSIADVNIRSKMK